MVFINTTQLLMGWVIKVYHGFVQSDFKSITISHLLEHQDTRSLTRDPDAPEALMTLDGCLTLSIKIK